MVFVDVLMHNRKHESLPNEELGGLSLRPKIWSHEETKKDRSKGGKACSAASSDKGVASRVVWGAPCNSQLTVVFKELLGGFYGVYDPPIPLYSCCEVFAAMFFLLKSSIYLH